MAICNLIIPTYNRTAYLRRILDYYSRYGEDFNIIVADSSSDKNKKRNRAIIASVSNLHIEYLDHYSAEINPHHKFADMLNYAQEKYCVFCADDDFVVPKGIRQSVHFLESHPDFVVAHGKYFAFYLEHDKKEGQQFLWQPVYLSESITSPDSKERLSYHLSNYVTPTIYAVHRTDILKLVYQETLKSGVDPILFGELLPSMLTVIYGKTMCLDVLYGVRDSSSTSNPYWPSPLDYIEAGTYDENYNNFRECVARHLSEQSQLDIEASKKVVDEAMSAYLKKYFSNNTAPAPKTRKQVFLDSLHLPRWMDRTITKVYVDLFTKPASPIPARRDELEKLEHDLFIDPASPLSQCHDDFNKIRLHVLAHSKSVYGKRG